MNKEIFENWLDGLKNAWESKDPKAASDLFIDKVVYYEDPFCDPVLGKEEVYKLWEDVPISQKEIIFEHKILAINENVGIAHFTASYTSLKSGERNNLEGVFVVTLDKEGLCKEFHWWWNSKSNK
jgi:hypothetical protein